MTSDKRAAAIDAPGIPERVPVIPLVSAILFPGSVLSLQVSIDRNVELLENLDSEQQLIGAFFQTKGDRENPEPGDLSRTGVLAMIVQRLPIGEDRYQLVLQGRSRIKAVEFGRHEHFIEAKISEIRCSTASAPDVVEALAERAAVMFEKLAESDPRYNPELIGIIRSNLDAGPNAVADLLATFVQTTLEDKETLLETLDPAQRLERLVALMQKDLGRATIDKDVERQTQRLINRREREQYLREQLRVILDELGETPIENEIDAYSIRVDKLPLEPDYISQLRREIQRLSQLSAASSDYAVIRGHIDTVLQMPWKTSTEDRIDVEEAAKLLDRNHYGLREVKERMLEFLSVLKLKGDLKGPILCFSGPPGVGKTSLGKSIADAVGRKFVRMSVGGVTDESEMRGHRKTYVGAMPGKLVQSYLRVGVNNPLVMIDEIDKIGKDYRGDPASALLEVLDPEQNWSFADRYLEVPFDLSRTLFITTANVLDDVPPALRDRLEVIRLAGYAENEKLQIATRHLLPSILANHGVSPEQLAMNEDAMLAVIREYTAEAGVRELTRRISAVVRKVARQIATQKASSVRITRTSIPEYLGMAAFEHEFAGRAPEVGVATGLAWTSVGGEIMFIEATRMSGSGRTTVTGHLGDIMKESVQIAFSYVRSRAKDLGIAESLFDTVDIHIHFPAGSIPKDGPSAGVTIATTIASIMSERPVRHDVAMTGELTLRGKILSVGGLKEKVIAARRASVTKVILPMGNRKDLAEVADEVKADLEFVFAERVEDVWREALMPSPAKTAASDTAARPRTRATPGSKERG